MIFREAIIKDIDQILVVRNSVHENQLSDPNSIGYQDCVDFFEGSGRGWVCETNGQIVGFSMINLEDNNVWALFIRPEFEGQGIGKRLHRLMLNWYFSQTSQTAWLGTDPNTRAEVFYTKAGWQKTGMRTNGEVRFEMSSAQWQSIRRS